MRLRHIIRTIPRSVRLALGALYGLAYGASNVGHESTDEV